MIDTNAYISLALETGFTRAAVLDVEKLNFMDEVRDMCAANRCNAYGKNWGCPPGCGTVEECRAEAEVYTKGVIVQYVGQLEDSFDFEGMTAASGKFYELFYKMREELRKEQPDLLGLGAGGCRVCATCTCPDAPCRFPDKRTTSMEAYGLLVSDVCAASGIPYTNGVNTVTYVGCFLMGKRNG